MPEKFADRLKSEEVYFGATYHYLTGAIVKGTAKGSVLVDFEDYTPSINDNNSEFILQYNDLEAGYTMRNYNDQVFDNSLTDHKIALGAEYLGLKFYLLLKI